MKKAVAFNIEIDYGQILYSLEKLHQSAVPSDDKHFEKVLRLWVSVYNSDNNLEHLERTFVISVSIVGSRSKLNLNFPSMPVNFVDLITGDKTIGIRKTG